MQNHYLSENCKLKGQWNAIYYFKPTKRAKIKKTTPNVAKNVEQLEFSCTVAARSTKQSITSGEKFAGPLQI